MGRGVEAEVYLVLTGESEENLLAITEDVVKILKIFPDILESP